MKAGIRQKALLEALKKGSVAATCTDAQADTSSLSIIVKSIKISIDTNFTVESNTELLAVKYSVPVSLENDIVVKEEGSVVVPAKEFIDWVELQGAEATINISLDRLAVPEVITTLEDSEGDDSDKYDKSKFSVKKIGTLKLSSKTSDKTMTKWAVDCFDPEDKASVEFGSKAEQVFEIQGTYLAESFDNVKFAAFPKDPNHVLDSISMQVHNNRLHFAATDKQHCAIYRCHETTQLGVNKPLLISSVLLDHAMKVINKDGKVTVSYDEAKNKVYIAQSNLSVRLVCTERQKISSFPSLDLLLNKSYTALTECSKSSMMGLLRNASFINAGSALFSFSKENNTLTVKAISEDAKLKPNVRQCEIGAVSKDARAVWGVDHLIGALKAIKSSEVQLHIPDNMRSLKITLKDNDNFFYFTVVIENAIYAE